MAIVIQEPYVCNDMWYTECSISQIPTLLTALLVLWLDKYPLLMRLVEATFNHNKFNELALLCLSMSKSS